jgi:hypothetical protein
MNFEMMLLRLHNFKDGYLWYVKIEDDNIVFHI